MRALIFYLFIPLFFGTTLLAPDLKADQTGQRPALQPYQFAQSYMNAQSDLERIQLNLRWAEYYLSADEADSAEYRLRQNLIFSFEKATPKEQLELVKSYVRLDRISEAKEPLEAYISRLELSYAVLETEYPEDVDLSWAYLRLGIRRWYHEDYLQAEQWWQRAYEHSRKYGHREVEIKALHHQGFVYSKQRKLSRSKSHYKYLLSMIDKAPGLYHEDRVLALNALGNAYNLNENPDSALYYFKKGLHILNNRAKEPSLRKTISANLGLFHHNIGNVLKKKNEIHLAIETFKKAIAFNGEFYGENSTQLIRSLREIGEVYQLSGHADSAKTALLRALEISKMSDFDLAKSYSRMGYFYQRSGQYPKALQYFDSALVSNGKFLIENKDIYIHSTDLFVILVGQSITLASDPNVSLEVVENNYERFTETVRFSYGKTDSDAIFKLIPLVLENLYTCYSRIYTKTPDPIWLNRLWEIMELNKAVKLRNQLNAENSLKYAIPEQFLKLEKSLKDSINTLMNSRQHPGFDSALFRLNRRYDEFLVTMERDFPRYYSLKNKLEITSLQEIRRKLNKNTMLLNFLEGRENIYMMKLSSLGISTQKLPKAKVQNWIEAHNDAVFNKSEADVRKASEDLRKGLTLDPKDLDSIRHLKIIPDGMVWNLNFASVSISDKPNSGFMGDQYTFSYQYFANKEPEKRSNQSQNVLAFSFSELSDNKSNRHNPRSVNQHAPIPGTSSEIRSISKLWEGHYYFAQNANETTFKQEGGKYSILHLAVHGFMDEVIPENSYLQFTTTDSLNDGKLHAYEIYNLDLNAELAVLSACHSGRGKVVAGEGMMSLGRAFAYSGVRSLLISRWEVSDYSAPHLMKYFYEGLKEGMFKSEALKYAQNKYLQHHSDALTSSPFYWSSFYILGDDSPITVVAAGPPSWLIWLFTAVLACSFVFYIRKTKVTAN